ncbi:MAG TPA: hypothetical protein VFV41_16275 [Streptosporangiaceae bacterium]|nr:hypothetical protein [Streptosporangiaceae bacterium]
MFFPDQPAVPPPPPGAVPPPAPRPPAPAAARPKPAGVPRRELRQRALAAAIFGLLSLLALTAANQAGHAIYLVVFALVVGLGATVLGITAGARAHREGAVRPRGSVAGIVLGVISVVLSLMALVVLAIPHQVQNYEQCMNNASTSAQAQTCMNHLLQAVQSHYGRHS